MPNSGYAVIQRRHMAMHHVPNSWMPIVSLPVSCGIKFGPAIAQLATQGIEWVPLTAQRLAL